MSSTQPPLPADEKAHRMALAALCNTSRVKLAFGLLVGFLLLFLILRYVNVFALLSVLQENLRTPRGIALALLAGAAYLLAWSVRGIRWKLFLNPIGKVGALRAIALYQIAAFINFLLPVQGGEVVKCFLLRRSTNIAVSASLPTVMLDKTMDLMPVLVILAIVPLLGLEMGIVLRVLLMGVGLVCCSVLFIIVLAVLRRDAAIGLLKKLTELLPRSIAGTVEGFATNFVNALLRGISQPKVFLSAIMLTGVAIVLDGLYATLLFWATGFPIHFGTATFGYLTYKMYHVLPTPPAGIGSAEAVGLLVFSGLLHLPALQVTAMFVVSHIWASLLIIVTGLVSLSVLGLTISDITKLRTRADDVVGGDAFRLEEKEAAALRE